MLWLGHSFCVFSTPTFSLLLSQLRKSYGNVFSVFIGPQPAVVINGLKAMKEALVNKGSDFAGRPQDLFINHVTQQLGTSPHLHFFVQKKRLIVNTLNVWDWFWRKNSLLKLHFNKSRHERLHMCNNPAQCSKARFIQLLLRWIKM